MGKKQRHHQNRRGGGSNQNTTTSSSDATSGEKDNSSTTTDTKHKDTTDKKDKSSNSTTTTSSSTTNTNTTSTKTKKTTLIETTAQHHTPQSFFEWCYSERQGFYWVLGCAFFGSLVGFGFGTGHLTGSAGEPSPWRENLSMRIKSTVLYEVLTWKRYPWEIFSGLFSGGSGGLWEHWLDAMWGGAVWIFWGILYLLTAGLLHSSYISSDAGGNYYYSTPLSSSASSSSSSFYYSNPSTSITTAFSSVMNTHNPYSDPRAFAVLRESIVREENGYVHPDLGFLIPAPCGATRGIGMISNTYDECQGKCFASEPARIKSLKKQLQNEECCHEEWLGKSYTHFPNRTSLQQSYENQTFATPRYYTQEEILLRIPLNIQLTRNIALLTLASIVPIEVQRRAPLEDLDDGILLALLLTHERGKGKESRWLPYIATLPTEPSCGYAFSSSGGGGGGGSSSSSPNGNNADNINNPDGVGGGGNAGGGGAPGLVDVNPHTHPHYYSPFHSSQSTSSTTNVWDTISLLSLTMGLDVNGWPNEVHKAGEYANRIATALARDYGSYIMVPRNMNVAYAIQWSLCMVSSRAISASEKHGSLRLVPMLDMINHHDSAGKFWELNGDERMKKGDLVDSTEDDSGTFIIRSMRHGRKKPLRKGQELLANYNVPGYSPLDWFLNLGFVPPERSSSWTKIDAALPRLHGKDHHHHVTMVDEGSGRGGTSTMNVAASHYSDL